MIVFIHSCGLLIWLHANFLGRWCMVQVLQWWKYSLPGVKELWTIIPERKDVGKRRVWGEKSFQEKIDLDSVSFVKIETTQLKWRWMNEEQEASLRMTKRKSDFSWGSCAHVCARVCECTEWRASLLLKKKKMKKFFKGDISLKLILVLTHAHTSTHARAHTHACTHSVLTLC